MHLSSGFPLVPTCVLPCCPQLRSYSPLLTPTQLIPASSPLFRWGLARGDVASVVPVCLSDVPAASGGRVCQETVQSPKQRAELLPPVSAGRHEYRWCCFVTAPLQRSLPGTGPTQGHGATDGRAFQASEPPGRTEGSVFPPRTFRGSACSGFYQTRVSTLSAWTSGCTF